MGIVVAAKLFSIIQAPHLSIFTNYYNFDVTASGPDLNNLQSKN